MKKKTVMILAVILVLTTVFSGCEMNGNEEPEAYKPTGNGGGSSITVSIMMIGILEWVHRYNEK